MMEKKKHFYAFNDYVKYFSILLVLRGCFDGVGNVCFEFELLCDLLVVIQFVQ